MLHSNLIVIKHLYLYTKQSITRRVYICKKNICFDKYSFTVAPHWWAIN